MADDNWIARLTISFPSEHQALHDWLVEQKNVSDTVRRGLYLLREKEHGIAQPETPETLILNKLDQLMSIRGDIADIRDKIRAGAIVASSSLLPEDQAAVSEILDSFGGLEL